MNPLHSSLLQDISVVIPAHNEERFIGSVVLTALNYSRRVIVVDDGSTDRTADIARAAGAEVIRIERQSGKGQALNAGFRYMRQINAPVVVTIDGDAQHDPQEIPLVAKPILEGQADMVIGSRFLSVHNRIPWWRKIGQSVLTWTTNTLSGARVTDSQSGYRAFSAKALEVLMFRTSGLSVESEMQFLIDDYGLNIVEVPVHVQYLDGNKRNPVGHGLQIIDAIMSMVARRHPLLLLALPGVILIAVGSFLGFDTLSRIQTSGLPLILLLATIATTVSGILLLLTGTILHSLEFVTERLTEAIHNEKSPAGNSNAVRNTGSA